MKHCQDWIVHFAGEKSKEELGQPMQPEFNDVLSEYTAYTQKTHGEFTIFHCGLGDVYCKDFKHSQNSN